jgi:hypothetical protein
MAMAINIRATASRLYGFVRTMYGAYTLAALVILLPMLRPGYILALDMVFTPELRLPEQVTSSYVFYAALHYLNFVIPGQVLQKTMLFLILFLSAVGMHLLVRHLQSKQEKASEYAVWGTYFAGVFYMVNPFTYSRFMAGQFAVMLGYALLPFFVRALLQFIVQPTWRQTWKLAAWLIAISIVSIHTVGLLAILACSTVTLSAWRYRHRRNHMKSIVTRGLAAVGLAAVASSYWIIPLATGNNMTAQAIQGFGAADRQAFATLGAGAIGKLGNVLQLQGFWAEGQHLYRMPQSQLPLLWGGVMIAVWVFVVAGAIGMWRQGQRFLVLTFGLSAAIAATLAVTGVPAWVQSWPLLAGYREPHKFVGLVALAYSLLAGHGAVYVLERYKQRGQAARLTLAGTALLLIAITYVPTMWWGFNGQLIPRQYPAGWSEMQRSLNQDHSDSRVLFLPWHLYMSFTFSDRIIVNPADKYFDKQTITSNDLEFNGAAPTFPDPEKTKLSSVLSRPQEQRSLGRELQPFNIKYVLLAKDNDYKKYAYLDSQSDLTLIKENADLKLYLNRAYKEKK